MTRYVEVMREVVVSSLSRLAVTLTCVLMVAGMCVAVLMTTGRTIGAEQAVLNSIDDAGSRAILVRAQPGAGLTTEVLTRLSSVKDLEWVGAFGSAEDFDNRAIPGGPVVPVRSVYTHDLDGIGLSARANGAPGAYASPEALQLAQAQGSLVFLRDVGGVQIPVVGAFHVPEYLSFLEPAVLVPGEIEPPAGIGLLVVVVSRPELIEPVTALVRGMLGNVDPEQVTVETSPEFAQLRGIVKSQLGGVGRSLVFILLGVTAFLAAAVQYGSVLIKRRDYGRRRALGATRMLVGAIVIGQAGLQSAAGATIGCALSFVVINAIGDPQPPFSFYTGMGILAVATGVVAAILPAAAASHRDPLKELRVP